MTYYHFLLQRSQSAGFQLKHTFCPVRNWCYSSFLSHVPIERSEQYASVMMIFSSFLGGFRTEIVRALRMKGLYKARIHSRYGLLCVYIFVVF